MFGSLDSSFSDARRVFRLGGFVKWARDLLKEPFLAGDTVCYITSPKRPYVITVGVVGFVQVLVHPQQLYSGVLGHHYLWSEDQSSHKFG